MFEDEIEKKNLIKKKYSKFLRTKVKGAYLFPIDLTL
jgi:hypothetical protein